MKFARMTDIDGRDVWIAGDWVQIIRHPIGDEYKIKDLGAIIILGSYKFQVQESPDAAVALFTEGNSAGD